MIVRCKREDSLRALRCKALFRYALQRNAQSSGKLQKECCTTRESVIGPICGGFVCCVLRRRWSTLLPAMGFHFVWNLFVGAADFAAATAITGTQVIASPTLRIEGAIFPLAGIFFCVLCLIILIAKRPAHQAAFN